ncbi:PREDICTED: UDP-glucuronosyltransferase 2B20-like [Rhagoletis zephyria]|uniref:UDP-glucuronosyltransferase 2B20-like n=1 Tax=Rhagoletis zephyria TaxID=28612 RepID=UPI0008117005|nr:PREDICTED: UDP-glucuronosyltransferase 2B20-like [Rhagoletis zephyria]
MRIDELVGNTSPLSYIPSTTSHLTDHMNFRERLENFYIHVLEWIHNRFVMLPAQYELYKKYVPTPTAPFMEMRKNFSLVLLNQHFSMSLPRPYVPNAIEVGGWHIDHKPSKLPADMAEFINAAPKGVIYFSLGTNIRSRNLSAKRRAILMEVFASLKQYNILWKFEDPELPGKPTNVFISKWFPQSDVLAHPKVKLFITHGGLLSTIEAIHHAKPVVGMPVFYDQHLNVARAQQKGFGVSIHFRSFTANQLKSAIVEVLENPKYSKRAQEISQLYHDQPETPVKKAIYWTEYVLRHKGAPHMRVAARNLNFIEYHNLDVIAVLFGGPLLALLVVAWVSCKLLKAIVGRGDVRNKKEKQS